jgi:hypothetical protein
LNNKSSLETLTLKSFLRELIAGIVTDGEDINGVLLFGEAVLIFNRKIIRVKSVQ